MVATGGLFTQSNPQDRKVVPDDAGDRAVFKVVYVVLESQYQSSLTAACKRINAGQVRPPPLLCGHATRTCHCCHVLLGFVAAAALLLLCLLRARAL